MAKLSLAARNYCVQLPEVISRVSAGSIGSSATWAEGWVFDSTLSGVILDNESAKAAIVFTQSNWQEPNAHNTALFPLITMDIWAAPTRDSENSIVEYDADDLIESIFKDIRPYFHTVNKDVPGVSGDPYVSYLGSPGQLRYWGTSSQIADKTGVPIISSQHINSSDFRDVVGGNGVRVRSHMFGIETF